ncbi:MAG: hypothetical protein IJY47_07685 [Clostridia bacterium]|nr:hypothetical protein [Clostridia bacterium]
MKRFVALLLVFLMCLPVLAACKKDGEDLEDTSEVGVPVSLITGGASEYVIVYATGTNEEIKNSYTTGKLIQKTVKSVTGVELSLVPDTTAAAPKEILVGPLSRTDTYTSPVSVETYQMGYSVFWAGEKIVLEAGSDTGLHFAACALLKELVGVDLLNNEEAARNESKTEFTVLSTFAPSETLTSVEVPYIGVPLDEFGICFANSDYLQKRAAIHLQQEIKTLDGAVLERVETNWAEEGKAYFVFEKDETVSDGNFRIRTEGKRIILSAKDYYGYNAASRAVIKLRKEAGFYPFRDGGTDAGTYLDHLKAYEKSAKYAYSNSSEYRLMFYNVFWGDGHLPERATLQVSMIEEYSPDVVGFQEFKKNRRTHIVPALLELGYAEAMDYTKGNMVSASFGTGTSDALYNYVPIFYQTATTKCIDSGYYRYTAQHSESESASKSLSWALMESKSTGERYLVVNTHMCTQDDSIKGRQAVEAVKLINELLTRYNVPVFLGGDYNGTYTNANYTYFAGTGGFTDIEKNNLATEYTSKLKSYHRDYPAYKSSLGLMWPAEKDDTGVNPSASVDHIMMKNASSVAISVYGVVADDYTMSGGDHYPIFVDFTIR